MKKIFTVKARGSTAPAILAKRHGARVVSFKPIKDSKMFNVVLQKKRPVTVSKRSS